jgi:hypothetical protein
MAVRTQCDPRRFTVHFGTFSLTKSFRRSSVTELGDLVHNNEVMNLHPSFLVVFAPAVLFVGVLAQDVFAKMLSPRGKGVLAVLSGRDSGRSSSNFAVLASSQRRGH